MKATKILGLFLLLAASSNSFAAGLEASDPVGRVASMNATPVVTGRAALLDALHDYAIAGEFPRNTDTPGARQMYFLDADGRPCAVAHLMIVSGRGADVRRIARTNNAVKVSASTRGAIADWIRTSGFTLEEIMQIQEPSGYGYGPLGEEDPVVDADRARIQRRLLAVEARLRARG